MDYRTMGRSGLRVSRTCLGALNFGSSPGGVRGCDESEARRIIDAFLDAGNNFIDTADAYTGGESEEIVGRAVGGRRESVVIATKAWAPQGPGPNDRGLSRAHLNRALDASLRRLGSDYVDLYQCHQWDGATPIEETMATLDGFVRSGKVRYVGCSNFTAAQIVESQWAADRVGGVRFVSLQPQYSLVARDIEAEILPTCERHGLGTIVYSPLGGGVLAGRYRRGAEPEPDSRAARLMALPHEQAHRLARGMLADRNLEIADEIGKIAPDLGVSSADVALAWVATRPGVTSVIIGPRTVEQYRQSAAAFDLDLPGEVVARLDEVSPPVNAPVNGTRPPAA